MSDISILVFSPSIHSVEDYYSVFFPLILEESFKNLSHPCLPLTHRLVRFFFSQLLCLSIEV